jgi:hypothetical protein
VVAADFYLSQGANNLLQDHFEASTTSAEEGVEVRVGLAGGIITVESNRVEQVDDDT